MGLLWVQLGSGRVRTGCPFYPQEPTSSDRPGMISDNAQSHKVEIIDNRAKAVACYDPGYTLVEKLQTMQ